MNSGCIQSEHPSGLNLSLTGEGSATRIPPLQFFRSPVNSFFNRRDFMSCCISPTLLLSSSTAASVYLCLEPDQISVSVPKLPNFCFDYGRNSHFGFGLISVTAVT